MLLTVIAETLSGLSVTESGFVLPPLRRAPVSKNIVSERMIARLAIRASLSDADRQAIRSLSIVEREVAASSYLIREGERPVRCIFLMSGFCYRQKLTSEGSRQIVSLQMPGDFLDAQNLFLTVSDHNVQALTRAVIAEIEVMALRQVVLANPGIATAMWIDALVDSSIFREWIVNVGRRDAHSRVGHLLCEFALRLELAGIAPDHSYELPMTQEQLGDAVGLTPVHVNRVLKTLTQRGLIQRDRRQIRILDWQALRDASDFNPRYLHLDQTAG